MKRTTASRIDSLSHVSGRHHVDDNLYLDVRKSGRPSWLFRFVGPTGRRRDMSLGVYPSVSLANARELAQKWRGVLAGGEDPIDIRNATRAERRREAQRESRTLRCAAEELAEHLRPTWRNDKHATQWLSSLQHLGRLLDMPVSSITAAMLLSQLEPIASEKRETAKRIRQRLEATFDREILLGHIQSNPAIPLKRAMRGPAKARPMPSLPWRSLPAFIAQVRDSDMSQSIRLSMEWLILTASRTTEVRGARWQEIDLDQAIWRIPASRMKADDSHDVPITSRMRQILEAMEAQRSERWDWVFPGPQRRVQQISSNAYLAALDRMGYRGKVTMHGMRATFSTWANETTSVRREVIEAALAHKELDTVRAAYNRADYWTARVELAEAWSAFATSAV